MCRPAGKPQGLRQLRCSAENDPRGPFRHPLQDPAIHIPDLPGNVGKLGKPRDRFCDFVQVGRASQHVVSEMSLRRKRITGKRGLLPSGTDEIDADIVRPPFPSRRFHQSNQTGLGSGVSPLSGNSL
jgi:hypothetical protein